MRAQTIHMHTQQDPRFAGLEAAQIVRLHKAAEAIRDGAVARAGRLLHKALAETPEHAETIRLFALLHARCERNDEAIAMLRRAIVASPDDASLHTDLGSFEMAKGARDAAFASWQRATELAPGEAMPWYNLGRNLQLEGESAAAVEALANAHRLAPALLPAAILLGDALNHLGRFDEADAAYRDVLAVEPGCGDAWRGVSNVKTRPLSDADAEILAAQLKRSDLSDPDRIAMGHALGKLEEDRGRYAQALTALSDANALARQRSPWSRELFESFVHDSVQATRDLPAPVDLELGREVIFLVGVPRSGSTLFEQILATHDDVEGASELDDLGAVIEAESRRRARPFPHWLAAANADDWQRMGREYLQRTARWRKRRPRHTDKLPENWKLVGVLRAMLPGANVIEIRRDPLETAWSCFRQQFYRHPHFACGFADISAYLRGATRAMDVWRRRDPDHIHLQCYEDLLAVPEERVRALLASCGLSFDARCLDFHLTKRSVRSASAAQVRQPLRRDTARTARYGALLDPLRHALAEQHSA